MKNPARRLHGVTSIIVFFAAVGLAATMVFRCNAAMGWLYLAIALTGTLGIVYSFCCKCCSKHSCSHVVLGMIARILPARPVGKYKPMDVVGMAASFLAIVAFPQKWLWSFPISGVVFWLLAGFVVWEIATRVCPVCRNELCPFHSRSKVVAN